MQATVINEGTHVRVTWQYEDVRVFKSAVSKITKDINQMDRHAFELLYGNVLKEYMNLGLVGKLPQQDDTTLDNISFVINEKFATIVMPQPLRLMGLFVFMGKTDVQFVCQNM